MPPMAPISKDLFTKDKAQNTFDNCNVMFLYVCLESLAKTITSVHKSNFRSNLQPSEWTEQRRESDWLS